MAYSQGNTQAENNNLPLDFFNYSKLLDTRNTERENKPFMWPGSSAHSIFGNEQKVVRGFMRSILTDVMGGKPISETSPLIQKPGDYRLNFQFNPESITRDVSQSIGAVNPILQNPANLTQAVPGTAVFNFTMTFNREMEVNNHNSNIDYKQNGYDIVNERDPGVIGVWADVKMFDTIIGQGITDELVSMVKTFTSKQQGQMFADDTATAKALVVDAATGKDKDGNVVKMPVPTYDDATFQKAIDLNIGNSAFLNPLPVRVVFSDTFMIEGLVEGAAVAFQKFSPNMTPTICQINVNFKALYLGFAKKDAFLTSNLSTWAKDVQQALKNDAAVVTAKNKNLKTGFTNIGFCPGGKWKNNKIVNEYSNLNSDFYPFVMNTTAANPQWWNSDEYWHTPTGTRIGTTKYAGFSANPTYMTLQQWWNLCNSTWSASPTSYTWTPYLKAERTDTWSVGRFNETFQIIPQLHKGQMPCIIAWEYAPKDTTLEKPTIVPKCSLRYNYKNETSTADCKIVNWETKYDGKFGYATFWLELPKDIKTTFVNTSSYSDTQIMMSASTATLQWTLTASKDITVSGIPQTLTADLTLDCTYDINSSGFYFTGTSLAGLKKVNTQRGGGGIPGGATRI